MAIYTTTIRNMIESGYDLGLKDYPIWSEDAREPLNNAIINHYYFREIGFETAGLFKFHLNRTMNEIMPYYNELYLTTQYKYDPTKSYSMEEIYSGSNNSNLMGTNDTITDVVGKSEANGQQINSDTPQGLLETGAIKNGLYATSASITSEQTNAYTGTNNQNNISQDKKDTAEFKRTTTGNNVGNVAELIKAYRENIIMIQQEIVLHPAIETLFMSIY